jgi:hypothetical protein
MQMRRLMMEMDEGARSEGGIRDERGSRPARLDIRTGADRADHGQAGEDPGNWPYLAI